VQAVVEIGNAIIYACSGTFWSRRFLVTKGALCRFGLPEQQPSKHTKIVQQNKARQPVLAQVVSLFPRDAGHRRAYSSALSRLSNGVKASRVIRGS
jgi:hypothetical protein